MLIEAIVMAADDGCTQIVRATIYGNSLCLDISKIVIRGSMREKACYRACPNLWIFKRVPHHFKIT